MIIFYENYFDKIIFIGRDSSSDHSTSDEITNKEEEIPKVRRILPPLSILKTPTTERTITDDQ